MFFPKSFARTLNSIFFVLAMALSKHPRNHCNQIVMPLQAAYQHSAFNLFFFSSSIKCCSFSFQTEGRGYFHQDIQFNQIKNLFQLKEVSTELTVGFSIEQKIRNLKPGLINQLISHFIFWFLNNEVMSEHV